MSTDTQELLKSFDRLPDTEKREVASEIIRRTFAIDEKVDLDETQLAALYAEFASEDSELADQGIDEYVKGLGVEDAR